jgi:hypothetical protein
LRESSASLNSRRSDREPTAERCWYIEGGDFNRRELG